MRKLHLAVVAIIISLTILLAYAFWANNVPQYDSSKNVINIIFKYGVMAKNQLNTFNGTFTKDLVIDGTITTKMILPQEELKSILQKTIDIGFFNYPASFPPNPNRTVTPQTDYYLKVQNSEGSITKEVSWNTNSLLEGNTEENLGQLAVYIMNMVEEKPEFKALPPAHGGYL
jgi:hypothetical protein